MRKETGTANANRSSGRAVKRMSMMVGPPSAPAPRPQMPTARQAPAPRIKPQAPPARPATSALQKQKAILQKAMRQKAGAMKGMVPTTRTKPATLPGEITNLYTGR